MKQSKIVIAIAALLVVIVGVTACNNGEENVYKSEGEKPINLSIFIDLSHRIMAPNVDQVEKDTLIVGETAKYFTQSTKSGKQGIQGSENIIKVVFNPAPAGEIINAAANRLQIDVQATVSGKERKHIVKEARDNFTKALTDVYTKAKEYGKQNSWPGSDLWGFFNNGVVDQQCIKKGYRNVLIVITDGEVFYAPINKTEGGKPNFVSSELLKNPNGKLLVQRAASLQDLEVMILELNPRDPKDLPRMKQVLEDWLVEMGVKKENISLYQTDTPANVRNVINNFLNK